MVPSPMWNPDTVAYTKCPAMEPMCQIMVYNQLPTSATIHKWILALEVGRFHISALIDVEPGHWGGHQVSSHGANVSNNVLQSIANFCHQSQVDTGSRSGRVPHRCRHRCVTRTLKWTPSVQPWSQCVKSCFIIICQLLKPFTSRPCLQKWAGSTPMPCPMWNSETGRTLSVRPWSQCVKSCFIINCQLLPPFTSGNWLQKWPGSTSVASPMWNPDNGADTNFQDIEPMCQIMFYNQLKTPATIHKWTWLQK